MVGEDVREVQHCMNMLGYTTGPEDGIYGPLTYAGITNYQKAMHLKWIDGIVGPETIEKLNEKTHIN
jgi:peptidoglycan hydrolase-like protein with peptidoglycan-binding domain